MKKYNTWINILLTLTFITIPTLIGYYFLLPDWTNKLVISYGYMWLIALAFVIYVIFLTIIFVYLKISTLDSINFNIPISIVFVAIFLTYSIPIWARFFIIICCIFLAFPINMFTNKLKYKLKNKISHKIN